MGGAYADPVALESTFGPDVQFPFVAPDGSYLLFVRGMGDIQVSFRDSGGRWGQPVSLGEQYGGMLPIVSPDGKYLAFITSRGDEEQKKKGAQVWILNRLGGEAQHIAARWHGAQEHGLRLATLGPGLAAIRRSENTAYSSGEHFSRLSGGHAVDILAMKALICIHPRKSIIR